MHSSGLVGRGGVSAEVPVVDSVSSIQSVRTFVVVASPSGPLKWCGLTRRQHRESLLHRVELWRILERAQERVVGDRVE